MPIYKEEGIKKDGLQKYRVRINYTDSLGKNDAVTIKINGRYAVFVDPDNMDSTADELCTVAHEWGHCETGCTHAVDSPYDLIVRHENRANKWAVHHILPAHKIKKAMLSSLTEAWQIADYYNLTEAFVRDAIQIYLCEEKL